MLHCLLTCIVSIIINLWPAAPSRACILSYLIFLTAYWCSVFLVKILPTVVFKFTKLFFYWYSVLIPILCIFQLRYYSFLNIFRFSTYDFQNVTYIQPPEVSYVFSFSFWNIWVMFIIPVIPPTVHSPVYSCWSVSLPVVGRAVLLFCTSSNFFIKLWTLWLLHR